MTLRPCLECGEPSELIRCPEHALEDPRPSREARGYDKAWRKLSIRARRAQPFCTDCGSVEDLTTDHSPEAWKRHEQGLPVRLVDVEVVCRTCNTRRGSARDLGGRGRRPSRPPSGKAESVTHMRMIIKEEA